MKLNYRYSRLLTVLLVLFVISVGVETFLQANPGQTADGNTPASVLHPVRVVTGPVIDGILDDDVWRTSPLDVDFVSYDPIFTETLPQKTLVWMAYDNKNLYFAFQCLDSEPQKIKTSITQRDRMFSDDWVGLSLDAQGSKQSSYHLFVNPNGIPADALNSVVAGEDFAPDLVWASAGRITGKGYQVEIAIPLRSIGYKSGKEVAMGILFWRRISRLGLSGSWPEIKPGQWVFNVHAKAIYKDLKKVLKLELLPSIAISRNQERTSTQEWGESQAYKDLGIGIKYGITSSITADITINPDFSQVESDAFQVEVNQRYPLFYSEKRPFFMEGSDIFSFFTVPNGYLPNPVHTRRIVNPLWGAKITGTLGKMSFGVLASVDETPVNNGESQQRKSFFGIARASYNLGQDNYAGILYSSRESEGEYNRVAGVDFVYRFFKNQMFNASFLSSMSGGGPLGTNHPGQVTASDYNLMNFYITRRLEILGAFEHIGKEFRMDTSFLRRSGIDCGWVWSAYHFYPKFKNKPWLKQFYISGYYEYLRDLFTQKNDSTMSAALNIDFSGSAWMEIEYIKKNENWLENTFDLGQFHMEGRVQLAKWLRISGEFMHGDMINYDANPAYKGKGYDCFFNVILQPNKNLNQQFLLAHQELSRNKEKVYNVDILYSKTTYQFNKYFFLRAILQYDSFQKRLLTDFLASFTFIPGTVFHLGYGGLYENRKWQDGEWQYRQGNLINIKRSFFLKASYLWRF